MGTAPIAARPPIAAVLLMTVPRFLVRPTMLIVTFASTRTRENGPAPKSVD